MNQTMPGRSRSYDMLETGESAAWTRTFRAGDVRAWQAAFGDAAVTDAGAGPTAAAGMLSSGFAALVESALPGPGSVIRSLSLAPHARLPLDCPVRLSLTVGECRPAERVVVLEALAAREDGTPLASGRIEVAPPATSAQIAVAEYRLDPLVARAQRLAPVRTAIVHPLSADALFGAVAAATAGLIEPVLYGPETALYALAAKGNLDIGDYAIVATANAAESAARAARDAGEGKVRALMKGSLATDMLLQAAMLPYADVRMGEVLSHVTLIGAPVYGRRIAVTDAVLNIAPGFDQKRAIAQNAIGLLRALGVRKPKLAVIAAAELVHARMPATMEAAALAKMADRGQITGGLVDGPLDIEAAVDADAARGRQIMSPVAGQADIMLVPNIETGNAVCRMLTLGGEAQTAGLVVGGRAPIILPGRADSAPTRLFSVAAAALYADALTRRPRDILPPDGG